MKSSVEKLSDTRVKLSVEVPFDELKKELDSAYKAIAQQVMIPGFRRGKAPRPLIDTHVGRPVILEQVINDMLPTKYAAAVEENDIDVIGQPVIDITELKDGEFVSFTATVDVRPEIDLPDFSTYELEVAPLASVDEVVDTDLDALRRRFATRVDVDRAAEKGDVVTVNLTGRKDGEEIAEATTEGLTHVVGSDDLIDGVDEAVVGLAADESAEFTTTWPHGEYKGEEITVTVTVTKVQAEELPEVDDEFAEMASEFDTVEELRADLASKAEERVKADQAAEIRDAVLNRALDEAKFELPEAPVEAQVKAQLDRLLAQLNNDEKVLNSVLAAQGMSREQYDKDARENAEKAVRTQLFLDALATKVEPNVTQEELSDHILFTAQSYGMDPGQFLAQVRESDQMYNLFSDVRRGKALAAAICDVSVKDTEGTEINPREFFGEEDVESTDSAESTESSEASEASEASES